MSYCELPKFFNSKTGVRSKKVRRCCECAVPIPAGEPHYVGTGCWDDGVQTYRQHLACKEACTTIREMQDGECIGFGELWEYWHDFAHYNRHKGAKPDPLTQRFRDLMAKVRLRQHRFFQARRRLRVEEAVALACQVQGAWA